MQHSQRLCNPGLAVELAVWWQLAHSSTPLLLIRSTTSSLSPPFLPCYGNCMDIVPWDDYSAVKFYLALNLLQNRHACFSMDELPEEKRVQVWSNDVALLAKKHQLAKGYSQDYLKALNLNEPFSIQWLGAIVL